ncbi:MAG: SPFH domain-containing protein [Chloroflexota bacterium]|nr:SPFH domain-containing protein [Chloroflexota bacterium]
MESLLTIAAFVIIVAIIVAYFGYFLDRGFGAILLSSTTVITSVLCVIVGLAWGWAAALGVVILIGWVVPWIGGKKIFSPKGGKFIRFLWFWYAALGALVFINGTWIGLVAIALPPLIILWGGLFLFSRSILPLQSDDQYPQAFRSLLTFALGTNFPYYLIRDWKKEEEGPKKMVEGNTFGKFFAGPGIIITSCDHLVVTTTRVKKNTVKSPGLTFTGKYESIQAVVDLRPQLRAFTIKAETQDGVPIKILSFWPCQIDTGGHQPGLGKSYPFDKNSVFQAVYRQPQGHVWDRDKTGRAHEELKKIDWDDLLPKTIAAPILKDIILEHTCDQLCDPGDPRQEIKQEIKQKLIDALKPLGIQVVGGGISNIFPSEEVVQQRIDNWKARWQKEIAAELGKLKAEKAKYAPETVRAQVQLNFLKRIAKKIHKTLDDEALYNQMLALSVTESIQEMMARSPAPENLSEDALEIFTLQRRRLGG